MGAKAPAAFALAVTSVDNGTGDREAFTLLSGQRGRFLREGTEE